MLKRHVEAQHNEQKYECEFEARSFDQLKNHKGSNQEGMRYECDNCEAGFTSLRGLKHHQQTKHEGYSYDCNLCDAKFHGQVSLD